MARARDERPERTPVRRGGRDPSPARERGRPLRDHSRGERRPRRLHRPRPVAEQAGGAGPRAARHKGRRPRRRVRAHRGGHARRRGGGGRGEVAVGAARCQGL